jgi:large subunit ribosomal protein LX
MSEVKVFRVTGKIVKPNLKTTFQKEVRALKSQDAAEKIYMELGSKHRAKRFHIRITKIEEISLDEIENPLVKELTRGEETNVA